MNNKNIVLVLPYFGEFPNYFNLWMKSASHNENIDFIIITDNPNQIKNEYSNIHVYQMEFTSVQKRIKDLYGVKAKINTPYKLCEYKPAFGEIFPELISGYSHWGFCDPDIIWGDLENFLTNDILNDYDRVYFLGHLTIYKNNEKMNSLYRSYVGKQLPNNVLDFKLAFSTDKVVQFSEMAGTSAWYPLIGVKTYSKIDFADINFRNYDFSSLYNETYDIERFEWVNGKLFRIFKDKRKEEIIYLHLQKRKMEFEKAFNFNDSIFFVKPNMFVNTNTKDLWTIDLSKQKDFENKIKNNKKKVRNSKMLSLDFWIYKLRLIINKKKLPKIPKKIFYPKYYKL